MKKAGTRPAFFFPEEEITSSLPRERQEPQRHPQEQPERQRPRPERQERREPQHLQPEQQAPEQQAPGRQEQAQRRALRQAQPLLLSCRRRKAIRPAEQRGGRSISLCFPLAKVKRKDRIGLQLQDFRPTRGIIASPRENVRGLPLDPLPFHRPSTVAVIAGWEVCQISAKRRASASASTGSLRPQLPRA